MLSQTFPVDFWSQIRPLNKNEKSKNIKSKTLDKINIKMDILNPLNDITSTKGKRKSSDGIIDENDENLKPSNSNKSSKEEINNKKVKVKDNIDTTDTPIKSSTSKDGKSAVKSTSRTALPRFVRRSRVSVSRSPRALTKLSKKDSKGNVLIEITDSVSLPTTTSNQSVLKQSTTSTSEDIEPLLQRLNEYTVSSESQGIIRNYFNKAFTSTIDDINSVINQTKTKSKW